MLYDCHLHTSHSHDSEALLPAICHHAMQKGLGGIAVTDHCDIEFYHTSPQYDRICASVREATEMQERFSGQLKIFRGVELGEAIVEPSAAQEVLSITDYDLIIGSVHAFFPDGELVPYSHMNFANSYSDSDLHDLLARYFSDVAETVETVPFDVLAHLTCPLRYINGKFHRGISLEPHLATITAILRRIIEKQIALELNCSGLASDWNTPMPDRSIWQLYRSLGGTLVTLGTDAHVADRVGYKLEQGHDLLRSIGFTQAYSYENRRAVPYLL